MNPRAFRVLLALSLAGNALVLLLSAVVLTNMGGAPWLRRKLAEVFPRLSLEHAATGYAPTRCSQFLALPIGRDDVVLLGDSILDYGEWNELLDDPGAKNRAINGDDTGKILARLEPIARAGARDVVLMCGINDIQGWVPRARTVRQYARIVDEILAPPSPTQLWVMPVIPINTRVYRTWIVPDYWALQMPTRDAVAALNDSIRAIIAGRPRIHLVEVPELLDAAGELRAEFTLDGIHLNGPGLRQVALRLRQTLPRYARDGAVR